MNNITKKFIIFIVALLLAIGIFGWPYLTSGQTEGIITSKEVKRVDNTDIYLIYLRDKEGKIETFKISDSLSHLQYRSSDLYGSVREGDKIQINYYGFRIPIYSIYKTIYKIKVLESTQEELLKGSNILYFEKEGNIYKYNIESKSISIYDTNIFKKLKKDNTETLENK